MEDRDKIELDRLKLETMTHYLMRAVNRGGQMTKDDIDNLRSILAWLNQELEIHRDKVKDQEAEAFYEKQARKHIESMSPPNLDPNRDEE